MHLLLPSFITVSARKKELLAVSIFRPERYSERMVSQLARSARSIGKLGASQPACTGICLFFFVVIVVVVVVLLQPCSILSTERSTERIIFKLLPSRERIISLSGAQETIPEQREREIFLNMKKENLRRRKIMIIKSQVDVDDK